MSSAALFQHAHSRATEASDVAVDLIRQFQTPPSLLLFFFSREHDGLAISHHLRRVWPATQVVGCSTFGEITTGGFTSKSVSAAALRPGLIGRFATALANFEDGVDVGVGAALRKMENRFGGSLRELDPKRFVGLVFNDSMHGNEDAMHVALGNAAPLLPFIGGSAADEGRYENTCTLVNGSMTHHGAALVVMEILRPFELVKSCHYTPTDKSFEVTRIEGSKLMEVDGRPAADVYSELLDLPKSEFTQERLALHPTGMMVDGEPWIRQSVRMADDGKSMILMGTVAKGARLHFMRPKEELVTHMQGELTGVARRLGGEIKGALLFDCPGRTFAAQAHGVMDAYGKLFTFPAAGFVTHGESFVEYVQNTMVAVVFG